MVILEIILPKTIFLKFEEKKFWQKFNKVVLADLNKKLCIIMEKTIYFVTKFINNYPIAQ